MQKLISYIEKNQAKKFIDHLTTLLENSSFEINQLFHKKDSKYSSTWKHTLFSYACMHGRLEICKYLLSKGADPIGKKFKIGKGFPLAISVLHNQFHISDWLQKELDIDCSISYSCPLTVSVEYGNLSAVKYALKHNADIHALDDYALESTAEKGYLDIIKYLVSKGADIHAKKDYALKKAVSNGHLPIVKYLLSKRADIHVSNDYALRQAAEKGDLDIVKYLVSKGADIHAEEDYALRWAAYNGHLSTVKYLISKGANIHAENDFALRWAVWHNHSETTEYLLDHGADPNAKDEGGHILQLLIEKNQLSLAAKAVSYGADLTALPSSQQQKLEKYLVANRMTKKRRL